MAKNQSTLYYGSAFDASAELDNDQPTIPELRAALMNALNRIGALEKQIVAFGNENAQG